MSIRLKIILVVLPLLIVSLVIGGVSSYYSATNGITGIAVEFFEFKVTELEKYVESQWRLLVENDLSQREDMIQAVQAGIEVYARSILRSDTEAIFALASEGTLVLSTRDNGLLNPDEPFTLSGEETENFLRRSLVDSREFMEAGVNGQTRVTMGFYFEPFQWYVVVSEDREVFYSALNRISLQTLLLVAGGSLVMVVLLLLFAGFITRPLMQMVQAMRGIIDSNDFNARVPVRFQDEIGQMSHTFNIMISELDSAYTRIKKYALDAAVSEKKESRIRHIFQKYVPQELIDQFFASPESMLVGQNRELSVLFSDIRGFTSISESMKPDELVNNLNRYFQYMVDIIMNRRGIIDKYIGDAIMAFFGAPLAHEDSPYFSVMAGMEMVEAVKIFNQEQKKLGKPEFRIGVGINYGTLTVGNIGTDRKLDYTVIGDSVNVASRLEGLTKYFHQELLIGEKLEEKVRDRVLTRLVGRVAVKGKAEGLKIYTAAPLESPASLRSMWDSHNEAMELFYGRDFSGAAKIFSALHGEHEEDFLAERMKETSEDYLKHPPADDWNGIEVMKEK